MATPLHVDDVDETAPPAVQLAALRRDVRSLAAVMGDVLEEVRTLVNLVAELGVPEMSKREREALPAMVRDYLERKRVFHSALLATTRALAIAGGTVTVTLQVLHR